MKIQRICLALALVCGCRAAAPPAAPLLHHDVYVTLREDTPEARAALAAACRRLEAIAGVLELAFAERGEEFARPVNDQDFDVCLHVVFADRAAHDRYQESPEHQDLLAEWAPRFESLRVFDSWSVPQESR
jgi:hypothetical protein